jgi:hypothetical protein
MLTFKTKHVKRSTIADTFIDQVELLKIITSEEFENSMSEEKKKELVS